MVRKSDWWQLSLPEPMAAGDLLVSTLTRDELLFFTRKIVARTDADAALCNMLVGDG